MKKLLSILLLFPLAMFGQAISPDMFVQPLNTGANMVIGVSFAGFDEYSGGKIGVFYDLNGDGNLQCVGLETIQEGFFGLAVWGDDSSTPNEIDGLPNCKAFRYAILHNNFVYSIYNIDYGGDSSQPLMCQIYGQNTYCMYFPGEYCTNAISNLVSASISILYSGCTDEHACNFNADSNFDDGSCYFSNVYYDCDGNCNTDENGECLYLGVVYDSIQNDFINSLSSMQQALDTWNTTIDLSEGWNMFGYGCPSSIGVAEGLSNHTDIIVITKDNNGNVYMPEFGFNGIGDFTPGFGYQIKLTEAIEGFSLCDWYVNDIPEDNIVSLQEENAYLLAYIDSINTTGITQIDPNAQQYNFSYVTTGTSHSIILPYYETENPNSINNIVFTGDITEPFHSGSLLGVFYTDYTNTLVCGGSSEWLDGSNQISAWLDDSSTPNIKDGFYENEPFIWFLLTPEGLFYEVTSIELANFNPLTSSYDPVSNTYSSGSFSIVTEIETQFVTQYEVFGCMDPLYLDYNEYANVFTDNLTNSSLMDSIQGNILVPDGIDDDCLIFIE